MKRRKLSRIFKKRRIHARGLKDFTVSVPPEFIDKNGIKNGDKVKEEIQPGGTLIISPRGEDEKVKGYRVHIHEGDRYRVGVPIDWVRLNGMKAKSVITMAIVEGEEKGVVLVLEAGERNYEEAL